MRLGIALAAFLYAAAGVVLIGYFITPAYFAAGGQTVAIEMVGALIVWTLTLTATTFAIARWRNRSRFVRT